VTVGLVLLVAALVLFILAAIGVGGRINLTPAGLACVVLALLVSGSGL
jgi:hypothetical protein